MRWFAGCAIALAIGCSAGAESTQAPKPRPATRPAPEPPVPTPREKVFAFPSGTFAIKATRKVKDSCGDMVWESDRIEIDAKARTLYSSPDDRLYDVTIEGGALLARGLFSPEDCGIDRYTEVWRLERDRGTDTLNGFVTTWTFSNPNDCLQACKAVFAVRVAR